MEQTVLSAKLAGLRNHQGTSTESLCDLVVNALMISDQLIEKETERNRRPASHGTTWMSGTTERHGAKLGAVDQMGMGLMRTLERYGCRSAKGREH